MFSEPRMTATMEEVEDSTTSTTLSITYGEERNDVVVQGYIFYIDGFPSVEKTADEDRRVTFIDLEPGTVYVVWGQATSGDQTSQPISVNVLTRKLLLSC